MTDQHLITPPHDQVYKWWEEACKRPSSSFGERLDYATTKAAEWGWQQRDASVVDELQKARDEELEECCKYIGDWYRVAQLRAARRPKPQSLAEEALLAIEEEQADVALVNYKVIRAALERLQELEGQGQLTKESD